MINVLISVIVPVYDVEKYLNRCITSIVNQTYKNLEIILVDDGSPDKCPQMCDEWAKQDNRIKVIHKNNEGLGLARNSGMDIATGDYVTFVDSDDWISTNCYKEVVDIINKHCTDIVSFGYYRYQCEKEKKKVCSYIKCGLHTNVCETVLPCMISKKEVFDYHTVPVIASAWSHVYSMNLIKQNNLRFLSERIILSEDHVFNLEAVSKAKSYYCIHKPYYYYNAVNGSLSQKYMKNMYERKHNMLEAYKSILKNKIDENKFKERINIFWIDSMYQCINNECRKVSNRSYIESRKEIIKIFNDNYLNDILKNTKINTTSLKGKILLILMKMKNTFAIYWAYKVFVRK